MKTVIITGTSSGIGLDLVKIFDSNGYRVISLSRNDLPNTTNFSENVNHINFDITNNSDFNSLVVLISHIHAGKIATKKKFNLNFIEG